MKNLRGIFRGQWEIQGKRRGICGLLSAIQHNYFVVCESYDCGSCVIPVYLELLKMNEKQ